MTLCNEQEEMGLSHLKIYPEIKEGSAIIKYWNEQIQVASLTSSISAGTALITVYNVFRNFP